MPYFSRSKEESSNNATRICAHPGCTQPGIYPALRPGHANDYMYLCLHHVREHHKKWNFFADMNADEAHAFRKYARAGERATRARILPTKATYPRNHTKEDAPDDAPFFPDAVAYLDILKLPHRSQPPAIRRRYRALVKRLHPDIAGADGTENLKEIIHAYKELKKIYGFR